MTKTYEAMFLMDPAIGTDFESAEAEVRRLLERAEAEVLGLKKWDERKLAYEIRRQKRGLYVLCYFSASPDKIPPLERDAQLSEKILRLLVVRRDRLTQDQVQQSLAAAPPPKAPARGSDEWSGGRGGGRGRGDDRGPRRESSVAVAERSGDNSATRGGAATATEDDANAEANEAPASGSDDESNEDTES